MTVICVRYDRYCTYVLVALPYRDSFAIITVWAASSDKQHLCRRPIASPLPSAAAALALDSRADMWSPRATNDWFGDGESSRTIDALQALANGQRSVEDPSGRLRNYAAGCLINVRQIMADHRDAQ